MTNFVRKSLLRIQVFAKRLSGRRRVQLTIGEKVRLRSGVKVSFHNECALMLGPKSKLKEYAVLECYGRIKIGANSVIGAFNWLQGSGELVIGENVIIGPHCSLIASEHSYDDDGQPLSEQPLKPGRLEIGNNVWIGSHVIVLDNVKIGNNVVAGAHSLVNRDVEDNCVVVGSPARVLKKI